jgi:predicted secreted protein
LAPGESNAKTGAKLTDAERLHHWLHLIAESGEHSVATVLVGLVADTLGTDAVAMLMEDASDAAKNVTPKV